MEIEKHWQEILGEPMSAEVSNRILKIQKALGIKDDDALWQIIIPLEYYQRIFEQFPEKARVEAGEVSRSLREASVAVTSATSAEVKASRELAAREIVKMQEEAKRNIAAATGGILKDEIEKAVHQLKSQSNRPLHRNWLIALGVAVLVAAGLGGWGTWSFFRYAKNIGEATAAAVADSPDFLGLMECNLGPEWKRAWVRVEGETRLVCYPYPDKDGKISGWRLK